MIIAGIYSFNGGQEAVETRYAAEFGEIKRIVAAVDGEAHRTKISKEKTMPGKILYKPSSLNRAFRAEFETNGWHKQSSVRVPDGFLCLWVQTRNTISRRLS